MSTTLDTSHFEISLLKAVMENIYFISVTLDTFHFEILALKDSAPENMLAMSVTFDTSHSPIGPCELLEQFVGDSFRHSSTAILSSDCEGGEKRGVIFVFAISGAEEHIFRDLFLFLAKSRPKREPCATNGV